jgi:hypothetical protein
MKKIILILYIVPSLIYCQDIEKKTSKNRNSFMIDFSYDSKLMNINEEYSITKPDVSGTFFMNERFNICFGYSINRDGNIYTFDNTVIGLDITNILHRLSAKEANPSLGLFLRVGRNNFYNHTEYTLGGPDIFFGTGMSYSFKTGLGYDYFLTENICLNSKIYYKYIKDGSFGSTINDNTFSIIVQEVKVQQIVLGIGLQIYLRKKSE